MNVEILDIVIILAVILFFWWITGPRERLLKQKSHIAHLESGIREAKNSRLVQARDTGNWVRKDEVFMGKNEWTGDLEYREKNPRCER